MVPSGWKNITSVDSASLLRAKEQAHQAAQIVAAVGRTYNPKSKDDQFGNFRFTKELEILQGSPIEGDIIMSSGLRMTTLTVLILDQDGHEIEALDLHQKTLKQALVWLEEQLVRQGLDGNQLSLQLPYEIPVYDTAKGKGFEVHDPQAFANLSQIFFNTKVVLEQITNSYSNASAIKCWPHHFDLATLITLNDTGNPETSTSIGAGMSPGDENYTEPYFYLTPWPYPPIAELPPLDGPGQWHTDGWVGAILTLSDLLTASRNNQEELVMNFMQAGIDHLKVLLVGSED